MISNRSIRSYGGVVIETPDEKVDYSKSSGRLSRLRITTISNLWEYYPNKESTPRWITVSQVILSLSSMLDRTDVEAAAPREEEVNISDEAETEALLPSSRQHSFRPAPTKNSASTCNFARSCSQSTFGVFHIILAFVLGAVAYAATQYALFGTSCFKYSSSAVSSAANRPLQDVEVTALAPPYVGSTEVHKFPPTKPTNAFPSLFPSHVGYAGGTPTGAEPAVIATAPAYPIHSGQCSHQLVVPDVIQGQKPINDGSDAGEDSKHGHHKFNLFKSWGNLSPWYSVGKDTFGVNSSPEAPDTCVITGLHFLHRHGARYPTASGKWTHSCCIFVH